jgi:hypothetical protein
VCSCLGGWSQISLVCGRAVPVESTRYTVGYAGLRPTRWSGCMTPRSRRRARRGRGVVRSQVEMMTRRVALGGVLLVVRLEGQVALEQRYGWVWAREFPKGIIVSPAVALAWSEELDSTCFSGPRGKTGVAGTVPYLRTWRRFGGGDLLPLAWSAAVVALFDV